MDYVPDEIDMLICARTRGCSSNVRARIIKELYAAKHGLSTADLEGRSLRPHKVAARWDALAAVRRANPMWSLPRLARCFRKHHTTILHALRKLGLWSAP